MKIKQTLLLLILTLSAFSSCSEAKKENKISICLWTSPSTFDPRIATDAASQRIIENIFNSLVRKDERSNIVPDLALSWTTPNDKTFEFRLRKNIAFHNGEKFSAHDVKFTYESILDSTFNSPFRAAYGIIEEIQVPDSFKVIFKLKKTHAPFLRDLIRGIVPQSAKENFGQKPIGTGAFQLKEFIQDSKVTLLANENYFLGKPKTELVEARIIKEESTRILSLETGQIDILLNNFPEQYFQSFSQNSELKVTEQTGINYTYLAFNCRNEILKDSRVRQAIAFAINRPQLLKNLKNNHAKIAHSLVPESNFYFEPKVSKYDFNLEKASRLLDEAGFEPNEKGQRFTLVYKATSSEESRQKAEIIKNYLAKIGINLKIESYEWATFFTDIKKGNFDLCSLTWVGVADEPDLHHLVFHTESMPPNGANRGSYSNPKLDSLLTLGRTTLDEEKRKEAYSEAQKIVSEELPYLSLWFDNNILVTQKDIEGFEIYSGGEWYSLKNVYRKNEK
ncbi:MAG: ABC transporter substrate-binding protein [Calditrichaeota bacterium]|nr:MAG: ABC transporter substrate-binding protein [Calditrichota bacterium]